MGLNDVCDALRLNAGPLSANRIIRVPLKEVTFPPETPSTFHLVDLEGQEHHIPFHRVREVYKNAQRIWPRPDPKAAEAD